MMFEILTNIFDAFFHRRAYAPVGKPLQQSDEIVRRVKP